MNGNRARAHVPPPGPCFPSGCPGARRRGSLTPSGSAGIVAGHLRDRKREGIDLQKNGLEWLRLVGLHPRSLFLREKLDCTGLFVAVTGRFSSVAARGMPQGAITDRLPPCSTLAPRRPPTIASPAPSRGFINRSYHYNSQITRTVLSLSFFLCYNSTS